MRQLEFAGRIPSFLVAVCLGFIALSIVGFGDIIPGNSVAGVTPFRTSARRA